MMTAHDLLKRWMLRAHRMQFAHYESARDHEHYHLYIGVPALIASTISGTLAFATVNGSGAWLQIGIGLLSMLSTVLVALQTFFRYPELAESHRVAGARFAHLKHDLELIAISPPADDSVLRDLLKPMEKRWNRIREDSPSISWSRWESIKKSVPDRAPAWDYTSPPAPSEGDS